MSLKPCRACKRPVAVDASTCPHCGKQNPARMMIPAPLGCLIAIIVLVIVVSIVS